MKLSDIPRGSTVNQAAQLAGAGLPVVLDKWVPKGRLLVFADVVFAQSMDDELTEIVQWDGKVSEVFGYPRLFLA